MGLPRGFPRCWRVATADTGFMPATPQPKSAVATIDFAEDAKHTGLTASGGVRGQGDASGLVVQIIGNLNADNFEANKSGYCCVQGRCSLLQLWKL